MIGEFRFEARLAMSNDLVIGTDHRHIQLVRVHRSPAMGDDGVLYCDACRVACLSTSLNTLNVLASLSRT